jgi:hypothetical protein
MVIMAVMPVGDHVASLVVVEHVQEHEYVLLPNMEESHVKGMPRKPNRVKPILVQVKQTQ